MKSEKLFEAFTELDDDLIENAPPKEQEYDVVKPALKIHSWKPWVAGAAVAAAAFGVTFAGMKLFSGKNPIIAPAFGLSDSEIRGGMYESGTFESGAFEGPTYAHMLENENPHFSAEEIVKNEDVICTGKVTNISFAVLDLDTCQPPTESSVDYKVNLFTIYDIELKNPYKGTVEKNFRLIGRGGIEGYKVDEQIEALENEYIKDKTIIVWDDPPEINVGEEYLFIMRHSNADKPCFFSHHKQTALPLSDPTYRDEFSNATVDMIINCAAITASVDKYAELTITHNNQTVDLANIDRNALVAAVQDATINSLHLLNMNVTNWDNELYGYSGYVIDLVFNDIDAPLAGGGNDKKAQTICHVKVLIGEYLTNSYIDYSYTSIGLDGSTELQHGGTYDLSEEYRNAMLALIKAGEPNHNNDDCETVKLFDYFDNPEKMLMQFPQNFTLPEFPDVYFSWNNGYNVMVYEDDKWELFMGMPVYGVYIADLNGDGKREICSTVSYGSGMIDNRIYAYDYANGKLYELQDRGTSDYCLTIIDGVLMYEKNTDNFMVVDPLTIDIMTEVSDVQSRRHSGPTEATSGTHHSEHDETHH